MRVILFITCFILLQVTFSQTSQVEYCKKENADLEKKLEHLNKLLEAENSASQVLKLEIVSLRDEIDNIKYELKEQDKAAVNLLNVALLFEKQQKFEEATEIYKLLIKTYPKSIEAIASNIYIQELRHLKK